MAPAEYLYTETRSQSCQNYSSHLQPESLQEFSAPKNTNLSGKSASVLDLNFHSNSLVDGADSKSRAGRLRCTAFMDRFESLAGAAK